MDRRLIIAITLSFVVLVASQLLFAPKQQILNSEKNIKAVQSSVKTATTPGKEPVNISETVKTAAVKKTINLTPAVKLQNLVMRVAFFSDGTVASVKLLKYKDKSGVPTELVTYQDNFRPMAIVFADKKLNDEASNVQYNNVVKGKKLLKNGRTIVVFTAKFKEFVLKKVFTFYPDKYLYSVHIVFENPDGTKLKKAPVWGLTLGPHLGHLKKKKYGFLGAAVYANGKLKEYKKIKEAIHKKTSYISWIGLESKYFASLLVPDKDALGFQMSEDALNASFYTTVLYDSPDVTTSVYMGPKEYFRLKPLGHNLIYVINYGMLGFLARPLLVVLHFFFTLFGNYGIAIIVLTFIIRLFFAPLSHKSFVSMKKMQELQPKIKELRQKYKGKPEQLNKATMELYKRYKVNPMGGCLPIVLQIPVFFALYKVLLSSIELRGAPFFLWIKDLSVADPYYITPILMGVSMFLQQKLQPTSVDPRQAKMMLALPVVFTFMFLGFPAGLVIYWLTNNLLAIAQQLLIDRRAKKV